MPKKILYQVVLFFVLISLSLVNMAGANFIKIFEPSRLDEDGSSSFLVKQACEKNKSNNKWIMLAGRSDKSRKSKKSKKSQKSEKSKKSGKSEKTKKSKASKKEKMIGEGAKHRNHASEEISH